MFGKNIKDMHHLVEALLPLNIQITASIDRQDDLSTIIDAQFSRLQTNGRLPSRTIVYTHNILFYEDLVDELFIYLTASQVDLLVSSTMQHVFSSVFVKANAACAHLELVLHNLFNFKPSLFAFSFLTHLQLYDTMYKF